MLEQLISEPSISFMFETLQSHDLKSSLSAIFIHVYTNTYCIMLDNGVEVLPRTHLVRKGKEREGTLFLFLTISDTGL